MNRIASIVLLLLSVALVPVALYLGVHVLPHAQNPAVAYWAPITVLVVDALLIYVALGHWEMEKWDRTGIAIVVPLLLAMASWAVMINTVAAQMPQPQLIQGN